MERIDNRFIQPYKPDFQKFIPKITPNLDLKLKFRMPSVSEKDLKSVQKTTVLLNKLRLESFGDQLIEVSTTEFKYDGKRKEQEYIQFRPKSVLGEAADMTISQKQAQNVKNFNALMRKPAETDRSFVGSPSARGTKRARKARRKRSDMSGGQSPRNFTDRIRFRQGKSISMSRSRSRSRSDQRTGRKRSDHS
jgi:hypothetical protein